MLPLLGGCSQHGELTRLGAARNSSAAAAAAAGHAVAAQQPAGSHAGRGAAARSARLPHECIGDGGGGGRLSGGARARPAGSVNQPINQSRSPAVLEGNRLPYIF